MGLQAAGIDYFINFLHLISSCMEWGNVTRKKRSWMSKKKSTRKLSDTLPLVKRKFTLINYVPFLQEEGNMYAIALIPGNTLFMSCRWNRLVSTDYRAMFLIQAEACSILVKDLLMSYTFTLPDWISFKCLMLSIVYFRIAHIRTAWNASMLSISKVRNIYFRKCRNEYWLCRLYSVQAYKHYSLFTNGFKGTVRPFEFGGVTRLIESGVKY